MMHKVKDVVTKFLNPSFLFSPNNDADRVKRKRSDSPTNQVANEQEIDRTPRNDPMNERRTDSHSDEPQLTDDEGDNNNRDVPSTEQQTKRRRTAIYQRITTTNNHHHDNERTSPATDSTDSILSSTHTTPILCRTSIEQNYSDVIHRVRHHYNLPSSYRRTTSNYDPSKSPLFSAGNRATTTSQSNETAANYLLATSLMNRSSPSVSANSQSVRTLTNPVLKQRLMYGSGYSAINPRRLPYIERLRRRTLQDCVRFDRTLVDEPLTTTTEKPQSTTMDSSPVSQRLKVSEKECGVQCDITVEGPNKKSAHSFPPRDIRDEALSIPTTDKIQTDSSITIEKSQPPKPTFSITKPKVLGNITPFSWPKFARAQDEYAKKYPDKCRNDAVVSSVIGKSNVSISSTNQSQTTDNSTASKNVFSNKSPSRPAESIWKCPCCTKEHPAQTASCSLCHGINPNYKKPSANQSNVSVAKEQLSTTITSSAPLTVTKESTTFTLAPPISSQITTTTKESAVTTASPIVTTSSISVTFPTFGTVQSASVPPTTTASSSTQLFGISPIMSQPKTVTTSAATPAFGVTPSFIVTNSTASSTLTNTFPPIFGVTPTTVTVASTVPATTAPSFGIVTTAKDTLINTSRPFQFGTLSSLSSSDSSMVTSPPSSFPVTSAFQPFTSASSSHLTTPATTSSSTVSIPFGSFSSSALPTTTIASTFAPFTSIATPLTTTAFSTGATITSTNISPSPNIFGTSFGSPSTTATTSTLFSGLSATSTFSSALTVTTSSTSAFGTSNFGFTSSPSTNPPFGSLGSTAVRPFAPLSISSTSTNNPPAFGSIPPFGASANPTPQFSIGTPSTNPPTSASSSVGGFAFGAQSSAPPLFGATSQPVFPTPAINFGVPPSTSTTSNPFDISLPLSGSTDSGPTLFTIGSGGSTSSSPRRMLRARRTDRS